MPGLPGMRQGKRHRPYSLRPRVGRLLFLRPGTMPRGRSAEWRTGLWSCRVLVAKNAGASRRSVAAISVPGTVASGRRPGRLLAQPDPAGFRRLRPHRVQPLKAAPRRGSGRRPRASRERGYEPRARAPHQPTALPPPVRQGLVPHLRHLTLRVAPSSRRLATTPSAEPGGKKDDSRVWRNCGIYS